MDEAAFRQQMKSEGYEKIDVIEWDSTVSNELHSHEFAASAMVLSGELTVTTADGKATTCGAHDTFALAANVPHAEQVGPEGVRFIVARKY